MVGIKICGITRLEDALLACELGVNALGFIFSGSPRKIAPQSALKIIRELPPFVLRVGVFVNEAAAKVSEISELCRLDIIQLNGDESSDYCSQIKHRVIKAFRIKDAKSLKELSKYKVDGYLLDSHSEGKFGGTGKTFDWDLAVEAKKLARPIILSGGLTPENVGEAVRKVDPEAVDVSSGVEESPGKKDHQKLKAFIDAVRCSDLSF